MVDMIAAVSDWADMDRFRSWPAKHNVTMFASAMLLSERQRSRWKCGTSASRCRLLKLLNRSEDCLRGSTVSRMTHFPIAAGTGLIAQIFERFLYATVQIPAQDIGAIPDQTACPGNWNLMSIIDFVRYGRTSLCDHFEKP